VKKVKQILFVKSYHLKGKNYIFIVSQKTFIKNIGFSTKDQ